VTIKTFAWLLAFCLFCTLVLKHGLERVALYQLADTTAVKYRLNVRLFRALIKQESGWNPHAVSIKGAVGLAQIMPAAAKDCGISEQERYIPTKNLDCGAYHLTKHLQEFKQVKLALCAYNAGAARVRSLGKRCPRFVETQIYVQKIMAGSVHN
jgi:soluble lytic murein transglycosylase-like protein